MATFKFYTSVYEYGTIEVEADTLEQAENKAYALDGKYEVHDTEVSDASLIERPQDAVAKSLLQLLHRRMTEQELNAKLTHIFGREIAVEQGPYDEDWQGDDYYTFSVDDAYIGGYFDIYYIKMNKQDYFYITEVDYYFE